MSGFLTMKLFNGKAAERAAAVAEIVSAAQVETVQSIEVDWKVKDVNGKEELVPVVNIAYRKKGGLLSED